MKYLPINSQLFIDNRKKFIAELPPNSMAIPCPRQVLSPVDYHTAYSCYSS